MVREDIVAGLRNAVERGYTLQQAKQTLLNSSYNAQEVEEAVNYLTGGVGDESFHEPPQSSPNLIQSQSSQRPQQIKQIHSFEQFHPLEEVHQLQQSLQQPHHKKSPLLLFLLILILLLLLGTMILSLLFKDSIIEFFDNMLF